jgi:hypothetical protein
MLLPKKQQSSYPRSVEGRQTPTRRVGAEAAEGRHPRGRQTPTHGRHGMQAPTRRVGADVGFSSLSSEANPMGEAGRTTAKLSDGSSHGVRAARSTRRSTNWRERKSQTPTRYVGPEVDLSSSRSETEFKRRARTNDLRAVRRSASGFPGCSIDSQVDELARSRCAAPERPAGRRLGRPPDS